MRSELGVQDSKAPFLLTVPGCQEKRLGFGLSLAVSCSIWSWHVSPASAWGPWVWSHAGVEAPASAPRALPSLCLSPTGPFSLLWMSSFHLKAFVGLWSFDVG